ncbi:MAG: serine hydrolase [Chloroflexi bacterium]|nr:serine hydrolase [Chloroflexota bacterium]
MNGLLRRDLLAALCSIVVLFSIVACQARPAGETRPAATPNQPAPRPAAATPTPARREPPRSQNSLGPVVAPTTTSAGALQVLLETQTASLPGTWGIVVHHWGTGETVAINADRVFPAASLFKLAVMSRAYVDAQNGDLDWNEKLTFTEQDRAIDPENMEWVLGSTVRSIDAVAEMIIQSSNSATAILLRRIGADRVNELTASYGLRHTRIARPPTTTPAEILALLERIANGGVVDQQSSDEMIGFLKRQLRNDRIPKHLPQGVEVAHKTGELPGVRHDAGIVYAPSGAYVVILMVEDAPDGEIAAEQQADLSRLIYDYFEGHVGAPGVEARQPSPADGR